MNDIRLANELKRRDVWPNLNECFLIGFIRTVDFHFAVFSRGKRGDPFHKSPLNRRRGIQLKITVPGTIKPKSKAIAAVTEPHYDQHQFSRISNIFMSFCRSGKMKKHVFFSFLAQMISNVR